MRKRQSHLLVIAPVTSRGGTYRRLMHWLSNVPDGVRIKYVYWDVEGQLFRRWHNTPDNAPVSTVFSHVFSKSLRILMFPMLFLLAFQIAREKPIQLITNLFYSDMVGLMLCRICKFFTLKFPIWTVYISGDPVPPTRFGEFISKFYSAIVIRVLKEADRVVFLSQNMQLDTSDKFNMEFGDRAEVIPISIEHLPESRKPLGNGCIHFGMVSRLHPMKRGEDIIKAFSSILKETNSHGQVHLDFWGDGEDDLFLRELSDELGCGGTVSFHGWVVDPYVAFQEIDVLVTASESEGTPRSILEAASFGVPSIATRVGGIPDMITDGVDGWLVDVGDMEGLSRAMLSALDIDRLNSYGAMCREKVIKSHSPGHDVNELFSSKRIQEIRKAESRKGYFPK